MNNTNLNKVKEQLFIVGLVLCAFSLSMPTFYFNLMMPLAILFKALSLDKKSVTQVLKSKLYLALSLSIILIFIGLIYTEKNNLNIGFTLFVKRIPFLLLPFLFIGISKKAVKVTLLGFALGVLVGAIICLINVCLTENVYGYIKQIYISNWYWNDIILNPIDKHPSYFSFYAVISFFIMLEFLFSSKKVIIKALCIVGMLFFITIILTLEARTVFMSFPILLFVYLVFKTKKTIIGLGFFLLVTCFGTIYFIYHPAKFHNIRILKISEDSNVRLNIFESSLSVIKDSPILGVGSGDITKELNKEYIKRGYTEVVNYNCHNQFLEEWTRGGIFGLLVFLILFFLMLKKAISEGDSLFLVFIISMIIFSMVESHLIRQQGITFFSFFGFMFYFFKRANFKKRII